MDELDYARRMQNDLVEQFKGHPHIEALNEVLGRQLQDVYDFFEQLRNELTIEVALGKNLDGIGDIVSLSRMEGAQLAGDEIPFDVLDDSRYRQYLKYKILKNTCNCTYRDIVTAFKMFWDKPLYYSEDLSMPATMIFDTGEIDGFVNTSPLFTIPLLRAAGVTLKLYARTKTTITQCSVKIASGLGYAMTETYLPMIEKPFASQAQIALDTEPHPVLTSEYSPVK